MKRIFLKSSEHTVHKPLPGTLQIPVCRDVSQRENPEYKNWNYARRRKTKEQKSDMKKAGKSWKKKMIIILISVVLCALLVLGGLMIYGKAQMGKIPGLTFEDALKYTTQGKPDARIRKDSTILAKGP